MKAVKVAIVLNCNQLCTLIKNKLIIYFSFAYKAVLEVVQRKPLFKCWGEGVVCCFVLTSM